MGHDAVSMPVTPVTCWRISPAECPIVPAAILLAFHHYHFQRMAHPSVAESSYLSWTPAVGSERFSMRTLPASDTALSSANSLSSGHHCRSSSCLPVHPKRLRWAFTPMRPTRQSQNLAEGTGTLQGPHPFSGKWLSASLGPRGISQSCWLENWAGVSSAGAKLCLVSKCET